MSTTPTPNLEQMLCPMNYDDLEPAQVVVTIRKNVFILTEASADAVVKFRNRATQAIVVVDNKVSGLKGAADAEVLLVSRCLYIAGTHGELRLDPSGNADQGWLVPLETVMGWPHRVQDDLYKRVRALSPSITVKAEEETDVPKELPKGSESSSA